MKSWSLNDSSEEFVGDLGEDTPSILLSMARSTFKGLLTTDAEFLSDYLFLLLTEDFSSEFFWFCDTE